MKHMTFVGIAAILCLVSNVMQAQTSSIYDVDLDSSAIESSFFPVPQLYNGRVSISKGDFYLNGNKLSEEEIRQVIGNDIYEETYSRAIKQRKLGNTLTIVGAATAGVGGGIALAGVLGAFGTIKHTWYYDPNTGQTWGDQYDYSDNLNKVGPIMIIGYAIFSAGLAALSAGIPLKIIGNKRLDWVEEETNRKLNQQISMNVGFTRHGVGVIVNF